MTVGQWFTSHGIPYDAPDLTVGEEQAVADPALAQLVPGVLGRDTADKMRFARQYWNSEIPGNGYFASPIAQADIVRAGAEWGYLGAVRGFDLGPATGERIPGVGEGFNTMQQALSTLAGTDAEMMNGNGFHTMAYYTNGGFDRDLIASLPVDTPGDELQRDFYGSAGIGGILRGAAGAVADYFLPGSGGFIRGTGGKKADIPFADLSMQQPRQLPMPGGGARPPALPPGRLPTQGSGGRRPSFKLSPYINPRTGRNIPWSKIAKIGAAAAALGISVEEYIRQYGVPRATPRMNVLNPRALGRSMRRVEGFACFSKKAITFSRTYRQPAKRKCKPRKRCA